MNGTAPLVTAGLAALLVALTTWASWHATDLASTQELGPMVKAILIWVHARTALGTAAFLAALGVAAVPQDTKPSKPSLLLGLAAVAICVAGMASSPSVAATTAACMALLLVVLWLRQGTWAALPLGATGASLAAVSYALPYSPSAAIPPLAAPFLVASLGLAAAASLAASRRAAPTVLVLALGLAATGGRLDPWPAPEAPAAIALPVAEGLADGDAIVVRDIGQFHPIVVTADGAVTGLPVPEDRLRNVRLDVDQGTAGAHVLPVLAELRSAGVTELAIRLADPPQDPTSRDPEIAILHAYLPDDRQTAVILRVHPEISLNGRDMPMDKAAYDLERRLRPAFPKNVGLVVSADATWGELANASGVARRAGGSVVLLSEGQTDP